MSRNAAGVSKRLLSIAAGIAVLTGAITGIAMWAFRPSTASVPPTVTRFSVSLAQGTQFTGAARHVLAISSDGTQIVYVANSRLYLRFLSDLEARAIPGTETTGGVTTPVFSPDSRSIAFYSGADRTLKRIAVTGGTPIPICPADNPFGMTWTGDAIVFGQGPKGIMSVSENGGKPEQLVSVKDDELAHGPQMLPGGHAVLFTLAKGTGADRWDKAQLVLHALKSGERKVLVEGGADARYVSTRHVVYAVGGTLFAVPFNLGRLDVTGGPVPVVEGVLRAALTTGSAHFSISDVGSAIYVPGPVSTSSGRQDLALIDRRGIVESLRLPNGAYESPRVSPDGTQVAVEGDDGKNAIVWVYDLDGTSAMRRITFGGNSRFPIWSTDGQRVTFQSDREQDLGIFWQRADSAGTIERLTRPEPGTAHVPHAWAPRGDTLLFSVTKGSVIALWTLSLLDGKVAPFGGVQSTSSRPPNAVFSRDGHWVAYSSSETGTTSSVFVQPFPATGSTYQISSDGTHPLWSADGKELFFTPANQLTVVGVTTHPAFTVGNPMQLPRRFLPSRAAGGGARPYDITPDGKGFIGMITAGQTHSGTPVTPQIHVVLNWFEELKAKVPTGK